MTLLTRRWPAALAVLACATACSSAPHRAQAHRGLRPAPTTTPVTRTNDSRPTAAGLTDVVLTTPTSRTAVRRLTAARVHPADDARVRTLLTWCTHTAATEDAAPTVYGPRLTAKGRHGRDFVYSYARALPAGTGTQVAHYAGRLADCWRRVLLPVMAATLDPHIDHLTQSTSVKQLPAITVGYGSAQAVEGVIRWHPTPAQTETSVYDVAVVFGTRTMVTVLAGGADGLTTGPTHLESDLTTIAERLRAAEHHSG